MATSVYEVLDDLRAAALDEQDKGSKFERLVKTYLLNDPEWSARFSDVWLWSDWPGREGRPDTGVDLVASLRDSDKYAAIQCKFYKADATVAKSEIDSFLSASSTLEFEARYIFDTAKSWSPNATDTLAVQAVPVQRVDIAYLDESAFDWSAYSWSTPEVLISTGEKALRPHQERAIADVAEGFAAHDRGKLVMACGTGKTYTSLKIAESLVGAGGSVLFLVPSIQLLSQSLREWMANSEVEIRPFAVCSDVRVGRRVSSDNADISIIDLTEPATTDATRLVSRMGSTPARDRMTVVFSTYQSIEVISQAQALGLPEFDLVVCDEAHRTTGVTLSGEDESAFVRVHDNDYLRAAKRLYMTATPRVFSEDVKRKAADAEALAVSMDNEAWYGPEFHRLGFGDAVEADLLTDYKVLVLAIDEQYVAENFQNAMATSGEIALGDAAKLIGCWNGLAKNYGSASVDPDTKPMKTAVAFAKDIKSSKAAALSFPALVERALQDETAEDGHRLRVEAAHVDGTMGIHERNAHLAWLKATTPDDVCRILSNARCLSEGVDVPSLDAVMFLTPRGSQVDVVQSVGRVMRKAPGKELGYIILPVVVPTGVAPEDALKDNARYQVVWQVLQALRSHDDRFHAMVNQIELNKRQTQRLVIDNVTPRPEIVDGHAGSEGQREESAKAVADQLSMDYGFDAFRDAMYARIVQKVGERRYWETWAKDVSEIAQAHIIRIRGLLADQDSAQATEFAAFLSGLRANLNESITADEAIEMLAQHLVTRPIFEALFAGYNFAATNPVAKTMEAMLASLDEHNLNSENATLETFYASVRRRVEGVNNAEGKQRILIELYDKFFVTAFKKTVDKLGIVYTPVEIVDFILKSADDVLRAEFGHGLTDENVHILDGFTGTGTFIVRLLQSGLIESHDLARKYANELHANEILLLAYYIAAVNIESAYADLTGDALDFPGLILADTFQSWEPDDRPDLDVFPENNARLEHLKSLPITVILGNPPYSTGQDSANEGNQNEVYPYLDAAIRKDFSGQRGRGGNTSLFDSYIRAIKWASLRLNGRGVIGFVTNGGFLRSSVGQEMRRSLADEFASIYLLDLRGYGLVGGEEGRREGRPVFEFGGWRPDGTEIKNTTGGSRAAIAIVLLVKKPTGAVRPGIHYAHVADYLSAGEKIRAVAEAGSVTALNSRLLTTDEYGDWLDHRTSGFSKFLPIGAKHGADADSTTVFSLYGRGLETGRDAWVYQSSKTKLLDQVERTSSAFNAQVNAFRPVLAANMGAGTEGKKRLVQNFIDLDPTRISWTLSLKNRLAALRELTVDDSHVVVSTYRPFFKQFAYFDSGLNHIRGQSPRFFPTPQHPNFGFVVTGVSSHAPFGLLMVDALPDLHVLDTGQFFARWRYEAVEDAGMLDLGFGEVVGGYRRIDNVTSESLDAFQAAYPHREITTDDVFFYTYGLLHSPEYRQAFAPDLKKTLPRLPFVADPEVFVAAGRALAEIHLGYEKAIPHPLTGLDVRPSGDPYAFFRTERMAYGKRRIEGKTTDDKSAVTFNSSVTLSGLPEEAQRFMLGTRSAVDWVIEKYRVSTDKNSGIVNDPNDWSREVGDPRYILDLLARVVTVSVETMKIVDALPPLDIIEGG